MRSVTSLFGATALLGLLFPMQTQARVFDFNRESLASYLMATYAAPSKIETGAFKDESTATGFSSSVTSHLSGEFGFVYSTKTISWRFGFEVMKPGTLSEVSATNGGSSLYLVNSDIVGYLPKLGLEINLKTTPSYRVFIHGFAGQTSVTVRNTYASNTLGGADEVEYRGNCNTMGGGLSVEYAGFDTNSFVIDLGYRDMTVTELRYKDDVNHFGTTRAAGDLSKLADGGSRRLDFTGPYVGLGLRFWLF